jgi:hypothetical protein
MNATIEEAVFSMWFADIHCGATDKSSMDTLRDHISSSVVNQKSVVEQQGATGKENENRACPSDF